MSTAQRPVVNERYELQQRIGRGGMADVYMAQDLLLNRPVAIKVLFPEFAADPAFVERFRREAQSAANLNHPNIVGVYDWGKYGSTYFIAMEFVAGRTLADVLRGNATVTAQQAADARTAIQMAAKNPYVDMFVWFIFRDSSSQTWFSGLQNVNGSKKPSYTTFSAAAKAVVGQTYYIPEGMGFTPNIDVPQFFNYNPPGSRIGVTYAVFEGKKKIAVGQPPASLAANETISPAISFRDVKGHDYTVVLKLVDKHGVTVNYTLAVFAQ